MRRKKLGNDTDVVFFFFLWCKFACYQTRSPLTPNTRFCYPLARPAHSSTHTTVTSVFAEPAGPGHHLEIGSPGVRVLVACHPGVPPAVGEERSLLPIPPLHRVAARSFSIE